MVYICYYDKFPNMNSLKYIVQNHGIRQSATAINISRHEKQFDTIRNGHVFMLNTCKKASIKTMARSVAII